MMFLKDYAGVKVLLPLCEHIHTQGFDFIGNSESTMCAQLYLFELVTEMSDCNEVFEV